MKKRSAFICTVALLLFFLGSLQAQQQSSAILKAGVNFANVTISDDGDIDDAKALTSFQVGIIGDFNLAPFLALQPGIVFTGKGSKTQSGEPGDASWYRATTNPYYIEIPVNLVLKTAPGNVRFFAGAGPYIAIGVAGKTKRDGEVLGTSFHSEKSIDWSDDDPTTLDYEENAGFGIMKRFDYGLNGLIGIEASNLVLSANFGLGLAKLQSGSNSGEDSNNKHRVFSLTAGFKF